jgi:glutamate racemase
MQITMPKTKIHKIGFYDSGIGGLLIKRQFDSLESNIKTVMLQNKSALPLGDKTPKQIFEYTKSGVLKLFNQGCDLVVLACNTATCNAIRDLQLTTVPRYSIEHKRWVNVLGIVRPTVEFITNKEDNKESQIVVLATTGTIKTSFYSHEFADYGFTNVTEQDGRNLASLIDKNSVVEAMDVFKSIYEENKTLFKTANYLILACTHYPYIKVQIEQFLIKNNCKCHVIGQKEIVAKSLLAYIDKKNKEH